MAAVRRTGSSESAITLSDLATALTDAVIGAKRVLDETTADVADQYRSNRVLRHLAPPAFAIGEVRVAIKFAIAKVERSASAQRGPKRSPIHVHVHVAAASLAEIAPHLVSEIEFRIAPEMKRAQQTEENSESPG